MKIWDAAFCTDSDAEIKKYGTSVHIDIRKNSLSRKEYSFECSGDFASGDFIVLEYEIFGIYRRHERSEAFIQGREAGEESFIPLCMLNDIITDGHRHRLTAAISGGAVYTGLRISFRVRAAHASVKIISLYSCTAAELPERFSEYKTSAEKAGFRALDLSGLYNSAVPRSCSYTDSGSGMPEGSSLLCGIPFEFGSAGSNIIIPPPSPAENDDIILNFGIPARRGLCRPESRDSETPIDICATAKEIIFAAVMGGNLLERWGFCAKDPTILGAAVGEVMIPRALKDVERFAVETLYADGTRDIAFPYNIGIGRHVMCGETGIYAVPVLPKEIKKVVFHNRIADCDISVAALTLNISAENIIPAAAPCAVQTRRAETDNRRFIRREGNRLVIHSGMTGLALDVSDGIRILSFINGYAEKCSLNGCLLKIRTEDGSLTGSIKSEIKAVSREAAEIESAYGSLRLRISLSATEDSTIGMRMTAENTGSATVSCGIIFPALDNVRFDGPEDGWYMFPKYQNAVGNGSICVYEESAPSFPMQFFDLFSPSQSGGIGLITKEKTPVVRKYALQKDEGIINAFVEYPSMYMKLAPGECFSGSETEIFAHTGDWHYTFNRYRAWLKTWYLPYKCQDREWYRSLYWLTSEITDFFETDAFSRLPVWYSQSDGTYSFQRIMDEMKEIYGCYPDILHMWGWCYDTGTECNQWGHYGREDYDKLGGLENLKKALNDCSAQTGAKISLYLHPTLLTARYPEAGEYQPELMVKNADGRTIGIRDSYRMCHANERWRRHSLDTYKRVIAETGFKIYYVDEFGLRVENRCYAENHGHPVPSNLLETDRDYISVLREETPADTVLYGEYAAADINARYIDCNISYHIIDTVRDMIETSWAEDDGDDTYGRVFTDLYRFAFPKIVQLVLPMAMRNLSWQPLKSTFFNAESIYDSFWDAEESRGRSFMAKAFAIKKQYSDCYLSDEPETMLPSPADGVYINRFPGKNRTVYNLYNSGYTTKRGVLLELPYSENTSYYDVWNGKECRAEIHGETVLVYGEIHAQDVGCIHNDFVTPRTGRVS